MILRVIAVTRSKSYSGRLKTDWRLSDGLFTMLISHLGMVQFQYIITAHISTSIAAIENKKDGQ